MAVDVSHSALPFPIKNARYSISIPMYNSSGVLTDPTTPASSVSKDNGAYAAAAETPTVIGTGKGSILTTFSGAETNVSLLVASLSGTGVNASLATLYPRALAILESGTATAGAAGTVTLAAAATSADITGCFVRTTGGTGGGGTGGANNQARKIIAYNPGTKVATITPSWEVNPDNTTTYDLLLPEGVVAAQLASPTDAGTAQAGAAGTITLRTAAPSVDISGQTLVVTGGTGALQSGIVASYNTTTKVATMAKNWGTVPDNTSTYSVQPTASYLTGDPFARIGAAGAGLTALGDTRIAHLDVDVSTRSTLGGTAQTGDLYAALTGAQAEPTAVPAANASFLTKLAFVVALLRNKKTSDGSNEHLRKDDDSGDIAARTVADSAGTTTSGKWT